MSEGTTVRKGPNVVHPERPSAVGSRNSLFRDGRDEVGEARVIINEEVDKILNHVATKLPPEVLKNIDVMAGLKEKLYNYINQDFQNMFNRYVVTMEDEMTKKVRDLVDREEMRGLARYTPREIAELVDKIGGIDKFNTGELEKSIINMFGHLQGHIMRGMNDLETETNATLRQKTDVGAFVRGENAYSIVKCTFKDNHYKPRTVTDVKLSINILDSELISPIYHYQITVEYLVKDLIGKHVMDQLDRAVEDFKRELMDEGKPEISDTESLFEKIKRSEEYVDDEKEDENSKRYKYVARRFLEKVEGLRAEIPTEEYDQLNIRETIVRIMDEENIRNRGFNTAVNSLTSILDTSRLGYQNIENFKNARYLVVKEYEDEDVERLPDERYEIRLVYYDQAQLEKERMAYDKQLKEFEREVKKVWDTIWGIYQGDKKPGKVVDYEDLAKNVGKAIKRRKTYLGDVGVMTQEVEGEKGWHEMGFAPTEETEVEKRSRTYLYEKGVLGQRLIFMRRKLHEMYGHQNPIERVVLDDRLNFLESKFDEFGYMINPYHVQPGLLLDVNITSIKKKRATLMGMANVLNEFLYGVSKGFQDRAFATFSRRRSTVRSDLDQTFEAPSEEGAQTYAQAEAPRSEMGGGESAEAASLRGRVELSPAPAREEDEDLKEL